jgi:hypothetical protein
MSLTARISEKVRAMEAIEIARLYRARVLKLAQVGGNPDLQRLQRIAREFEEVADGLQEIVEGRVSYVA